MLLTFKNTRSAIRAEKALQNTASGAKVIPVPRSISAECGMALEIDIENYSKIESILNKLNIEFTRYNEYEK